MIKLDTFNGGLSTKLDKRLIPPNEAILCKNVDISSGIIKPLKQDISISSSNNKSLYIFNDTVISSNNDRDYVEFQGNIYYSDKQGEPKKSTDGSTWVSLGIEKPSQLPLIGNAHPGNKKGLYSYCYTYFNAEDGTESAPSVYRDWVGSSIDDGDDANLSVTASDDNQVTNIKIYRLGGHLVAMTLVATLSNTDQDYLDELSDLDIMANEILATNGTGTPPIGLKYLTEHNAMFFGVTNTRESGLPRPADLPTPQYGYTLWYSEIGKVSSWSAFDFITFEDEITGIGSTQNGLLVFTANKTYIISGSTPETMTKYLLDGSLGCSLHKSIKYVNNRIIWLSNNGLCTTNGGYVENITINKLGSLSNLNLDAFNDATVLDDIYYICSNTGTLAMDMRTNTPIFSTISINATSLYSDNMDLYYINDSNLYKYNSGSINRDITYSTGFITTERSYMKYHCNMRICYEGNIGLYIQANGVGYNYSLSSTNRTWEEIIHFRGIIAEGLEFKFSGTGIVYELSYDEYNRYDIMSTSKFLADTYFKESIIVNRKPTIFNKDIPNLWISDLIPLDITNNKLFKTIYVTAIGTVSLKVFIDSVEIHTYMLESDKIKTYDLKLPSSVKRGYNISFEVTTEDTSKIYVIDAQIEERQV